MIYNYYNYKGGINNLCVVYESFKGGVSAQSTKGLKAAFKNFKRAYKKHYNKPYIED